MSDYLLAYDLGTTGVKASLIDAAGRMDASASAPYPTDRPHPGWAEQSTEAWWDAMCAATRELFAVQPDASAHVAAIGLSGMMNGVVLVDDKGEAVRPALIHADIRSSAQCKRIGKLVAPLRAYDISGNRLAPFFTHSKLAWLAEHEPETLKRARWCVQTKDYIAGRLTGVFGVTDPSDASLTAMYNMRNDRWSDELVDAGGFNARLLPEVIPSTTVIGAVTREAARQTGLREGTPVVLGGGDGACATAGSGAVAEGDGYHYLGGTSWIGVVTEQYTPDPAARISSFRGFGPARYVNYGTTQSACSAIEWFLDAIGVGDERGDRYAALASLASQSLLGARGLIFLPYLQGERAPIWDADARGAFIGLTTAHGRADLARAVHEGVAFALGSILDVYVELGIAPEQMRVLGGGMRSALWRSIFADVFARPLLVLERLSEATSRGAAIAAGMGVGLLSDWSAARDFARVVTTEHPDAERVALYRLARARFDAIYPAIKHMDARESIHRG